MSLTTRMADALLLDPIIADLTDGRVYDTDIRREGAVRHPEAWDADGVIRPLLIVDDAGDVPLLAGAGTAQTLVEVTAFAPAGAAGRETVALLLTRALVRLAGWRDPETRAQAFPAGRLGMQDDGSGVFDRRSFRLGMRLPVEVEA